MGTDCWGTSSTDCSWCVNVCVCLCVCVYQHFNEYGHRLLGHFLYGLFLVRILSSVCLSHSHTDTCTHTHTQEAGQYSSPFRENRDAIDAEEHRIKLAMPSKATEVFQRVSSGSTGHTLSCNLTLTQVRLTD